MRCDWKQPDAPAYRPKQAVRLKCMAERLVPVEGGELAVVDHGGRGPQVLLVHGSGHNAAAWDEVVAYLLPEHEVVAVDLRGHGHSTAESATAEQYWRDLGTIVEALGWEHPVLVGHSTGGYAVTAATAAGLVTPAALCVVDGLVLDDRDTAAAVYAGFRTPEAVAELNRTFRYGWRADEEQVQAYIDERVRDSATDWLEAGASIALVRAVATRSFLPEAEGVLRRRPSTEEIAVTTTGDPSAAVYPSVDVYDHITCPLTIVLPDNGFYAARRSDVEHIVVAGPDRQLVDIASNHNTVMTHPAELAEVIRAVAARSR